jgi:hypothetical protein
VSTLRSFWIRTVGAAALLATCLSNASAQQAEAPQLYGYGSNAKGEPTYFRVRLPSVAVIDIGPDGFPFPTGTAYDSLHDRYYWIELNAQGAGTLWVSQGLHGRPTALGSSGQFLGASVVLAYNQVNGLLYALAAAPERATSALFSIDPATGQRTTVSEYAGSPAQISCDNYSGCVYLSAAGEQLLVYQPPQAMGAFWNDAPPIASSTPLFADLHTAILWTLDAGDPAQGRAPQLLGYGSGNKFYAGLLTYQVPLTLLEGADPSRIEGLFGAPSETGDLYGYGTDEKGKFTYFRFSLVQAEAADIGAEAFPFPLDAAYDPVHNVRYSINVAPGASRDPQGQWLYNTLYRTDGRTGETAEMGTLPQDIGPNVPAVAYQASTGLLYAASWNWGDLEYLNRVDPGSLTVTPLEQSGGGDASGVRAFCWNPPSGILFGLRLEDDFSADSLYPLDLETGQRSGTGLIFDSQWIFCTPTFEATGRYLYVVGYQTNEVGSGEPPHLLVFDLLEPPPVPPDVNEPVLVAPLLGLNFISNPSIGTLFFAPPL